MKISNRIKNQEIENVIPRTGPRPASSIPIMQGFDAHFGRIDWDSDPIWTHPLCAVLVPANQFSSVQ